MLKMKSLGHACFTLSTQDHSIIFDPWLADNPEAICGPDDIEVDAILASHGHSDHLGDAIAIARRLKVPIVAPFELAMYCNRFDCETAPMHIGGSKMFDFGHVKLTMATHGSAVITDHLIEYTGPACGFVVTMDEATVYYAGDTGLFGDMELIGELADLDAAVLPIGDNFTMGPEDALIAAQLLEANLVVPTHYSAFDVITQDADAFADQLDQLGIRCAVLKPGEEVEI
jgi:L-ascorbate metabolism protein UlaG (beta-lactamase superfamily)